MKLKKLMGALFAATVCLYGTLLSEELPSVKPNGCKGPVLCSNFPVYEKCHSCCDRVFHIDVGLLYQQPWFSDMNPGIAYIGTPKTVNNRDNGGTTSGFTSGDLTTTTQSKELEVCFDYSLGLTASLGTLLEHDDWFVGVEFDWMSSKKKATYNDGFTYYYPTELFDDIVVANAASYLAGWGFYNYENTFLPDTSGAATYFYGGAYEKIYYQASVNFYNLDFILSRGSYHSKCYSFEPFAGVKVLWYNGYQEAQYFSKGAGEENTSSQTYTAFIDDDDFVSFRQNFDAWGVGPMFGFNGEYYLTHQISIFSDSDIAVLYGHMKTSVRSYYSNSLAADSTGPIEATAIRETDQEYFVPVRSILGVKLAKYCLEDKHYLAVKIGYDARYIFTSNVRKDYAMNGLYVNFIWDF